LSRLCAAARSHKDQGVTVYLRGPWSASWGTRPDRDHDGDSYIKWQNGYKVQDRDSRTSSQVWTLHSCSDGKHMKQALWCE
jgi:hypothetical protein